MNMALLGEAPTGGPESSPEAVNVLTCRAFTDQAVDAQQGQQAVDELPSPGRLSLGQG